MAFNQTRAIQVLDRLDYIDSVVVPAGDPENRLRPLWEEQKELLIEARGLLREAAQ
jgi:hypothetical protein